MVGQGSTENLLKDQISTLFSNAVILKSVTGEKVSETNVGEKISILLDLRNHLNQPLSKAIQQDINAECNLHKMSYFTVGGERLKF